MGEVNPRLALTMLDDAAYGAIMQRSGIKSMRARTRLLMDADHHFERYRRLDALVTEIDPALMVINRFCTYATQVALTRGIPYLINAAAERLGRAPGTLLWYEDVPYVLFPPSMRGPAPGPRRRPRVCRFRAGHWRTKLAAIECYASQRDILWRNPTGLARVLTFRGRLLGWGAPAERYWSESSQAGIRPGERP
ncbi:hypothetical protein [Actinomadura alba]|uniref:hypothetical protein n=1 Tax=Actinomadura alba TaxID=406431 RepID=UPI0031D9B674